MSKIWPIFGNIILFILVVGGASYILIQLVGREDDPEPQILGEVKIDAGEVVANEAIVDEVSNSDSVQIQTIVTEPTRVVTATSSLSSTEPHLKLVSLTRFNHDNYPCTPHFAPSGDNFLCYLSVKDKPQLWVASLDEGLKRPLVTTNQLIQFNWFDDRHVLYTYWTLSPTSTLSTPQPVFLMNINSDEQIRLGQTTQDTALQKLTDNRVAFLDHHEVNIIGFGLGAKLAAESHTTLPIVAKSLLADRQTSQTDGFDLASAQYGLYFRTYFKASPNAQKVAVLQTAYQKGTLAIIDVQSQQKTVLVEDIAAIEQDSFSWSPDSTRLVYTLIPTHTYIPELWMAQVTDLESSQLLWVSDGPRTVDFVTWLPDTDEILYIYIPTGTNPMNHSIYQVLNVKTREYRELFTNGWGLELSLDRANAGYRLTFYREFVDGKLDQGTWIATLAY